MKKVIVIGGGAAGFFAAINAKELNKNLDVIILEKAANVLQKVKISGGGRCNVTHACFIPKDLSENYPRGKKELLGPFHQFMTGDVFDWFQNNNIELKIEDDGRVFPVSNSSQTIIDCFLNKADSLQIPVITNCGVVGIEKNNEHWIVKTKQKEYIGDVVIFATGSSPQAWKILENLQHHIIKPVPSLFTFHIKDDRLTNLSGISVEDCEVTFTKQKITTKGPVLITHWGLSGPAILKLSAFGARAFAETNYNFEIALNWLSKSYDDVVEELQNLKTLHAAKNVGAKCCFDKISKRLWEKFVAASKIDATKNWGNITKNELENLANQLTKSVFNVNGKSTFKEEFVTAGGVDLKEINFKTFESKIHQNLYLIGEVIDIDAVTGGFNFQNAWTGGYICANSVSSSSS